MSANNNINPRDTSQSSSSSSRSSVGGGGQQNALRQLGNRVGVASVLGSGVVAGEQPNHRQQIAGDRYERVANAEYRNRIIAPPPPVAVVIGGGVYETGNHDFHMNNARSAQPPDSDTPSQQLFNQKEGWTQVSTNPATSGRPPCQRSLHAAAVLRDSLYVFGGYDGLHRVNDLYEFHFPSRSWRQVITLGSLSNADEHTRTQVGMGVVTATGQVPSPRDRHTAVTHGSTFYVFGGFDGTSRVSDLFGFDVDLMAWREVRPRMMATTMANNNVGNYVAAENLLQPHPALGVENERGAVLQSQFHPPPSPRHSHAAVVYRNCMYIFGGYDGSYRSDFHKFDFDQLTWKPVPAIGRSPRARYRSTACVLRDTMILFGGHDGTRHLADVHLFDFQSQAWSCLVAQGVPPLPRDSHVSVSYKDSMYVFGGSTGSAMNDLFELNFHPSQQEFTQADAPVEDGQGPEEGERPSALVIQDHVPISARWRQIPIVSGGMAVHRFCHVGSVHKGFLYIFGGYDGSSRLNDFVKYDLAADTVLDADIPPSTILSDLRSFLDDDDVLSFADLTVMVEGVNVCCHKVMLLRCPYFRAMLLSDMAESTQSVVHLTTVRHGIFTAVLEYLYTDNVVIPLDSAMELFVAADCFQIPRLQAMCERRLLASMTVENAASIFHAADVHSATSLRDKALSYILSHFESVSKTATFEIMARSNVDLVFEILKSR